MNTQNKVVIKGTDSKGGVLDLQVYDVELSVFAAAPDLLEAAEIGLLYINAMRFNTENPRKRDNFSIAASRISSAISKAKGEQQ